MTLRELWIYYQATVMSKWDHTAVLASNLHNVAVVIINFANSFGKGKSTSIKPATFEDFHPYRKKKKVVGAGQTQITKENFHVLKGLTELRATDLKG